MGKNIQAMTEIGINDKRPINKPILIVGEEKVIVFDNEAEKQQYFDELIKNQPSEKTLINLD
jgi:hypothetical protein